MAGGKDAFRIPEIRNPLPEKDDDSDIYVTGFLDGNTFRWCFQNAKWRTEMLKVAYQVMHKPGRIQEAKRNIRGEEVVGYCYTGRPESIPGRAGQAVRPLAPWEVVVVFVDMGFNLWEWGIEDCEEDDDLQPKDDDGDRYGEVFYPAEE